MLSFIQSILLNEKNINESSVQWSSCFMIIKDFGKNHSLLLFISFSFSKSTLIFISIAFVPVSICPHRCDCLIPLVWSKMAIKLKRSKKVFSILFLSFILILFSILTLKAVVCGLDCPTLIVHRDQKSTFDPMNWKASVLYVLSLLIPLESMDYRIPWRVRRIRPSFPILYPTVVCSHSCPFIAY